MDEAASGHLKVRVNRRESLEKLVPEPHLESLPPDTAEVYEDILESLGLDRVATATEEDKQLVVEGQVLVLGDSREGKTSLVNALTGKKHDPEQPKTRGVESQFVSRKWRKVADSELKFGDFDRFVGTEITESAFVPRIFNEDKYRYRNNVQDPDRLEIAFYNFVFGRVLSYLVMKMSSVYQQEMSQLSDDEVQFLESSFGRKFDIDEYRIRVQKSLGIMLMYFVVAPLISLIPGIGHQGAYVFVVFIHVAIEYFKTMKREGIQRNFFKHWGSLLGFEFAVSVLGINSAIHDLSVPICDVVFGYMYSSSPTAEAIQTIVNGLTILILSVITQFVIFQIMSFIRYINSKFQVPYSSNTKLLIDIILDVRDCLLDMLFMMIFGTLRVLLFPIPPLPYRFYFPPLMFFLHLLLMHQQGQIDKSVPKLVKNYYLAAVVVAELSVVITALYSGCNTFTVLLLLAVVQFFIHCHGRWYQVKDLFKGKSFNDVIFRKDFVKTALTVEKATLDKRKLKEALDEKYASLKLKIIDFAGDDDYYYYHHIFLKTQAIYLIVFNIKSFISENFMDIKQNMKRLRFWFESVCAHVPANVPIILVGTHRDKTKEDQLKILDYHLREELWHDFCDHLILNQQDGFIYFHVENTEGIYDKGILLLRRTILNTAEKECARTFHNEIPLSWMKIQDYILTIQERSALCCIKVEEFQNEVSDICSHCSVEMLQYFHNKGLIIYLHKDEELSKWVLLNPALLIDIIVHTVNPPPDVTQERGYRQSWRILINSGKLAQDLLCCLLAKFGDNWQVMRKFLECYDLICPLEHADYQKPQSGDFSSMSLTHFIPSMLPPSASLRPIWCCSPDDHRFYVSFECFPPEPLFHRLMSRAYKLSSLNCPGSSPSVRRDDGLFWITPQQPYRLTLLKMEGFIEVTISRSSETTRASDVLSLVWSMVDSICRRDFQFVKFHCGPECPSRECPGAQSEMTALSSDPSAYRKRHIFNVLPAGRVGRHRVSFYCLNKCFESELKKWVPN